MIDRRHSSETARPIESSKPYQRSPDTIGLHPFAKSSRPAHDALAASACANQILLSELFEVLETARRVSERTGGAFDVTVGALWGWRFRRNDPRMPEAAEIARQLPLVNWKNLVLDRKTKSAFLARAGMRIDLGGIAKVYILRAGLRTLERHGVARAMVNGGGDVLVTGRAWRIGVRDPRAPDDLMGSVEIDRGVVVTSGDYERFFLRDRKR